MKPYPRRISVPCCISCNNDFSKILDPEFSLFLSGGIEPGLAEPSRLWTERALPSLRGDERRKDAFLRSLEPVFRREVSGELAYLGTGRRVDAETVREMLKRIARGLFYHAFGEVLGDVLMEADLVPALDDLVATCRDYGAMLEVGDQFACFYGRDADSPKSSLWLFNFHDRLFARVLTGELAGSEAEAVLADNGPGSLVMLRDPAD